MNPVAERYSGNLEWLPERTILFGRHGSHAYGLNTPTSDEDFKGVAIPPKNYFTGFANKFEQAESRDPHDFVIYDIRKFMLLAADCNPNIIEVLWSEPMYLTAAGNELMANRDLFLSKKAKHTFSGYAIAQLKRIKTHYRWLKTPPAKPPTRSEFGLPERTVIPADQLAAAQSAVEKKLLMWGLDILDGVDPATRIAIQNKMSESLAEMGMVSDSRRASDEQFRAASRTIGYDDNFIHLLDLERQYTGRLREWQQYEHWKATRNAARSKLESKYGYDTKHGMHLVRLLRMCREILEGKGVIVKRPDREELLAVRNGAWEYERLVEWAEQEDKSLEELYAKSALPKTADRDKLDKLCQKLVEASW